jgi:glucokinase
MTQAFLAANPTSIAAAAFGVAGPVVDGRTETVNLAWPVDESEMATSLALNDDRVTLLNDLEANAWGVAWLTSDDLVSINDGDPDAVGNQAVISAGTGLGMAGLYWDGHEHHVFATEGGHADFAPADALQGELLVFLRDEIGHVSWERVCSGMGLVNIERFLRRRAGEAEPDRPADEDAAAAISDAALQHTDEVADAALELMIDLYGRQAGNLALTLMAVGGVFVGGGIAPKILPRLTDGRFLGAFVGKGRFDHLLRRIPVRVILNELTALLGAGRRASRDLAS